MDERGCCKSLIEESLRQGGLVLLYTCWSKWGFDDTRICADDVDGGGRGPTKMNKNE